jgi:hypothetical protein
MMQPPWFAGPTIPFRNEGTHARLGCPLSSVVNAVDIQAKQAVEPPAVRGSNSSPHASEEKTFGIARHRWRYNMQVELKQGVVMLI